MRFAFDLEFDLDLLILGICALFATKKIFDICVKDGGVPYKMREPKVINLDDSEDKVNSDDEV